MVVVVVVGHQLDFKDKACAFVHNFVVELSVVLGCTFIVDTHVLAYGQILECAVEFVIPIDILYSVKGFAVLAHHHRIGEYDVRAVAAVVVICPIDVSERIAIGFVVDVSHCVPQYAGDGCRRNVRQAVDVLGHRRIGEYVASFARAYGQRRSGFHRHPHYMPICISFSCHCSCFLHILAISDAKLINAFAVMSP